MRTTGGVPTLENVNAGAKPGEPAFFSLESQEWTFISVFLVQDSKVPIQGAYILRSEFEVETRDLTLQQLKEAHPTVRLSPMEDIQSWIDASETLKQHPGDALQMDPVVAASVTGEDLIGKVFCGDEEGTLCEVIYHDVNDEGVHLLYYEVNGDGECSTVGEVREWVQQYQHSQKGSGSAASS